MLQRKVRSNSNLSPCQCKAYKNSLPQFLKHFKHRNSIERTLPLLDNYDNMLLQSANSFRTGSIISSVKVTDDSGNKLLINTQKLKNSSKKENEKEVTRFPDLMNSKFNPNVHEIAARVQSREI